MDDSIMMRHDSMRAEKGEQENVFAGHDHVTSYASDRLSVNHATCPP